MKKLLSKLASLSFLFGAPAAPAAVVFNLEDGLDGGSRWNATGVLFSTPGGSVERSLSGGLRYSLQGGSYASYRDLFTWSVTPTVTQFQTAISNAFDVWTTVDPVTKLGTPLSFVYDSSTAVDPAVYNYVRLGSEIDLFAGAVALSGPSGEAYFNSHSLSNGVTLTSGTTGYSGYAITGADITLNVNAVWDIATFQLVLTHEIGHAIGLGDVEDFYDNHFIDNNYSAANPAATLTDSWALLVNPLDPGNSPGLSLYDVPNNTSGIDAPGNPSPPRSRTPRSFEASAPQQPPRQRFAHPEKPGEGA